MHLSSAIPWWVGGGGGAGQIQLSMGTFRGFERSLYPAGGGNEGGFRKPCTPGKTGGFLKEIFQFQVVLHQ